jgi:20S proteasome subunit alpha 7
MVHAEVKDKTFQLQMSWVCQESNGLHKMVPEDLHEQAETFAKNALDESDSDDE